MPRVEVRAETYPEVLPRVEVRAETSPEVLPRVEPWAETSPEVIQRVEPWAETSPEVFPRFELWAETHPEVIRRFEVRAETSPEVIGRFEVGLETYPEVNRRVAVRARDLPGGESASRGAGRDLPGDDRASRGPVETDPEVIRRVEVPAEIHREMNWRVAVRAETYPEVVSRVEPRTETQPEVSRINSARPRPMASSRPVTSVDSQGSRLRSGLGEVLRFYGGTLHYHVGLLVFGAALVAPVFGAGEGLGVPHLYLHDDFGKQCVSGLAVGLVYFHIGILAFVLANGHKPKEGSKPPTLVVWELLGWSLGPPALVLAIVPWVRGGAPHDGVAWLTGVAWSIGITLLILFGSEITVLSELIKTWFGRLKLGDSKASSGWWTEVKERICEIPSGNDKLSYVRAACVGFSLLLLLGWMVLSAIGMFWPKAEVFWILPAAVPFAVTLAFWASVYSVLRFLIRRLTIPLLVGVGLFALVSIVRFPRATAMPNNCANATDERKCEDDWEAARSMADATAPFQSELASDTEALQAHLADDGPLVIITTSGGGARSAAWTTAILARLEQPMDEGGLDPEFFRHVRLITGASGGMVGASFWVAELVDADQRGGPKPCGRTTFEKATKGSLSGPFARLLLLTGRNRGEALERAWEHHAPALEIPFRSLEELEQAGKIPSLVFAPMIVEDASQMLFSNLDLGWYALADGPEPVDYVCPRRVGDDVDSAKAQIRCPSARQFFARVSGDQVKLSTLARVSAAFPYMSPAVTLPFAEEPRAVDAGYYDNYGTRLATAWITHHVLTCRESKSPGCLTSEGRPVLLLELRDHDPRDWSVPNWQWKHELTSPVEGLLNGRVHVALHRNSDAVARLEHLLGKDAVFAHVVLQFEGEAALSWELTNADREEIWDAAHALQLRELAAWWTRYGVSSESDLDAASDCSSISGPSFWPNLRAQATH